MPPPLQPDAQRRQAVAWTVAQTANTPWQPRRYERQLQERLQRGEITLLELAERLQACVYQVLYHSQALFPFSDAELQALLDESRAFNAAHGITGLLLYSAGRFVQVLEGDHATVRALYARIQQDPGTRGSKRCAKNSRPGRLRPGAWPLGTGPRSYWTPPWRPFRGKRPRLRPLSSRCCTPCCKRLPDAAGRPRGQGNTLWEQGPRMLITRLSWDRGCCRTPCHALKKLLCVCNGSKKAFNGRF